MQKLLKNNYIKIVNTIKQALTYIVALKFKVAVLAILWSEL